MASEVFSPTSERKGNLVGGVSSAETGDQIVLRLDPTTKRLLVSATITSYTGVTDGEAVDSADTGTLILGTDGTNYQVLAVNSSGHLLVDIQDVSLTVDSEFPAAAAATDNFANPTTTSVMGMNMIYDGSTWDRWTGAVTATDLDIRDLANATDSVAIYGSDDGGTTKRIIKTDAGGSIQVDFENTTLAVTNAGTFVVQENGAALTALQLIDDIIVAQGTALGTTKVGLIGGSVTTAAPTFTTGQINQLSLTTSGALRVDLGATSANATAVKVDGSAVTQPVSGTFWQTTQPVSLASVPSHAVTNAGTFAVQVDGSALTSLQLIDDAIYASDGVLSKSMAIGAVFDDATPVAITENQGGYLRMSSERYLYTEIRDAAGNERGMVVDASGFITANINGTVTVDLGANNDVTVTSGAITETNSGAIKTAVELIDNAVSGAGFNITQLNGAAVPIGAGLEATALRVTIATDSTGVLSIDDNGGAITVDGTVTANLSATDNAVLDAIELDTTAIQTAVEIMDDWDNTASDGVSVSGDTAHDGVDAGEPVKIGGKALDLGATPTAVAANDRVNAAFLRNGTQMVLGGNLNVVTKNYQVTDADGAQTDTDILGAVGAGTAIVVTQVSVVADNANTVDVSARIGFGATNTPAADAAGVVFFHPGIPAGGGQGIGTGAGIIGVGASGEELRLTCEDPVTGSISVQVTYFLIAIG